MKGTIPLVPPLQWLGFSYIDRRKIPLRTVRGEGSNAFLSNQQLYGVPTEQETMFTLN